MHLVNDINLVLPYLRCKAYLVGEFANVFNGVVGRSIKFEYVVGKAVFGGRTVSFVDFTGEDPGAGRFTYSTRTTEQECLCELVFVNSMLQGICNMRLPYHSIELLRAVFSCRNHEIFHWSKIRKLLR